MVAKRILVVDDSETVRGVIRFSLEALTNFQVCAEAGDGTEAIRKAQESSPDLILLDLAMPGLNGADTASILKKLLPQVPIVLFTMYSEGIGRSVAAAAGIDAVVSKHEGVGQMVRCVKTFLQDDPV